MSVPYNALPIEIQMMMIGAEQANVPVLIDAARMWTEVREWIETTRTELNTRVGELGPGWTDDGGRAHEEQAQRTLAELTMWAERLDVAQVPETLTTLAGGIQEALQTVTGFYESYTAAVLNPLTAWTAPGFQQLAGARMTALGAQFDMSMLRVAEGAGIQSLSDVLPESAGVPAEGNSPADFVKAATAGVNVVSELQSLASSVGDGSGASSVDIPSDLSGPSLAGLALSPSATAPVSGSWVPPVGSPPVPSGGLGWMGMAGGVGMTPLAKLVAGGKRAPELASEVRPGAATPAAAKPAVGAMPPPMTSSMAGQHAAGTLRPASGEHPTGRSRGGRRPAAGTDGVPVKLRGRSGKGDPTAR